MNRPLERFLRNQTREAMSLAARCPLLELMPLEPEPVSRYLARFECRGLVKRQDGRIVESAGFELKIRFPNHYLKHASTFEVFTWLDPDNVFHPNVLVGPYRDTFARIVCIGVLPGGVPLTRLLLQCHNVLRYNNFNTVESDALNPEACRWARNHPDRFPIDDRQLVWQPSDEPAAAGNEGEA